jgi:oxygen-independent coproporphyrinogen-3 oxidase
VASQATIESLRLPPLGLYVHLPWCVSKCPYCDFNSHPLRSMVPEADYGVALLANLDDDAPAVQGREIVSIYFGGGTPSLFSGAAIGRLIEEFSARLALAPNVEITLEANPGTLEHDSFRAYRAAGVNRVSLGVQSFDDGLLQALGRIHDRRAVHEALASLDRAGIDNFNIDLMFGLPGQTPEQALEDLRQALAAGPVHLSHYQLTLEPNTAFARNPPDLPGEDDCWDMQELAAGMLRERGFEQYEVSAWARPGRRCVHNLNYWRYGDFLGLGAGAHSKVTSVGSVQRWAQQRHPRSYFARDAGVERRSLERGELVFEFFLNRLRLSEGFSPKEFEARTGLPWSAASQRVAAAVGRGLLEQNDGQLRTTELGRRFVNDIQAMFLP